MNDIEQVARANTPLTIGNYGGQQMTDLRKFHKRCWCGIVHGPLRKRDVPREPREDNAYVETGTGEWIPGPRDFEGEP